MLHIDEKLMINSHSLNFDILPCSLQAKFWRWVAFQNAQCRSFFFLFLCWTSVPFQARGLKSPGVSLNDTESLISLKTTTPNLSYV